MAHSFEKMMQEHQDSVLEIFNYYTRNSFAAYPDVKMPDFFFSKLLETAMAYPAFVIKSFNGDVIGFCMLRPYNPFSTFKETAEITCFIKPEFTGKGIGKSALSFLEKSAAEMGIKHLLADISSENRESIEFHKRNGFSQCGEFNNIGKKFGKSFSVIWMEKKILQ